MKKEPLPADSKSYSERAFIEKEKWHRRRVRMSLTRKIQALDRLLEMSKQFPRLGAERTQASCKSSRPEAGKKSDTI